jgi:exodeoxyribonuclease V beta subunit
MTEEKQFDAMGILLEGTNLIEASAGTGKTHALTTLFLRLILENGFSVDQILVVTFTQAATEELKDRIRGMLRQAEAAYSQGRSCDPFLSRLIRSSKGPQASVSALRESVRAFDEASIYTIHGFCRRMLLENAFESGALFDTELVTDLGEVRQEIVDDFWRQKFYLASPRFVTYALNKGMGPGMLLSLVSTWSSHLDLKITPQLQMPDTSLQERAFQKAFDKVAAAWPSARKEIESLLTSNDGLKKNQYPESRIPQWIRNMDHYVTSGGHDTGLFKGFDRFTCSQLKASTRKGRTTPQHPFFQTCEGLMKAKTDLEDQFKQGLLALKAELLSYVEKELQRRKAEKNIQSFDDLLLRLNHALKPPGGDALAAAIRRRFKAALIDEFQDTDAIQYTIFTRLFATQDRVLFLIGDPKQAIYSFRGADVFTYMEAARAVDRRYTIGQNWRSEPQLLNAVNTLFSRVDRPFFFSDITFRATAPAPRGDTDCLSLDGTPEPPFQVWFLSSGRPDDSGKPMGKIVARSAIAQGVASEITRLLRLADEGNALLGERPLAAGDIAVLVRTNAEARLMQSTLAKRGIPSVLYSAGNLFHTRDALQMERLMAAIADPYAEQSLKWAITTDLIGVRAEELERMTADQAQWESRMVRFREYHELWATRGFVRAFRHLLKREKVLRRLLSLLDGERRCTNLLHLSELLHQAAVEKRLGMGDLLKWLSDRMNRQEPGPEEHLLRLESDENAVQIVTIHKSKGLEYPIVFCPFSWDNSRPRRLSDPIVFHDGTDRMRMTLDLGTEDMEQNRVYAETERLAEDLRLLYVALTRAKNRCYLTWGRFNQAETSALAYLLHQPEPPAAESAITAVRERFLGMTDRDALAELQALQEKARDAIELADLPSEPLQTHALPADTPPPITCRHLSKRIDTEWQVSSFSSLVSNLPHREELPDRDGLQRPDRPDDMDPRESMEETPSSGIFAFPKGAKAGTFFHDILEHLDFKPQEETAIRGLVLQKLSAYGFEPHWTETICQTLQNLLRAPLSPEIPNLRFSSISLQDRLNELEFYFPLKPLSVDRLKGPFSKYAGHICLADAPKLMGKLQFAPVKGFMRGFMDLVFRWQDRFYLVDWKSNLLGSRASDYGPEALATVMGREYYLLQYHLYTVALDQYLRLRLPGYTYETHFGGVFYVFLRGVEPTLGPEFGVFRDLPPPGLIKALREELIQVQS